MLSSVEHEKSFITSGPGIGEDEFDDIESSRQCNIHLYRHRNECCR